MKLVHRPARWLAILAITVSGSISFAADTCPASALPAPSGKYSIGTTVLPAEKLKGKGTSRQVQLWYPAQRGRGVAAPYIPSAEILAAFRAEHYLDQPDCVFDLWAGAKLLAILNAPVASGSTKFPFVLIAPGASASRVNYSHYAQQLASDGYIVATIDFAVGGFMVQNGKLLQEGPEVKEESDYAKLAQEMARHISDVLDQHLGNAGTQLPGLVRNIDSRIDRRRIAAMGHSLGGAAALNACRDDSRIGACVDMDGAAEPPVAGEGIKTSALMLRSHPDYSDADLVALHRDPAKWKAMGEKAKAELARLLDVPGPAAWIVSIHGTGHFSYSDAPFVMPNAMQRFGGTYLDPRRTLFVSTKIVEGYFNHIFRGQGFSIQQFPEATVQAFRAGTTGNRSARQ